MRLWPWVTGFGAASAATLLYGALWESSRLVVQHYDLHLPGWPEEKDGFTIVVLGDLHVRDEYSVALARRAAELAVDRSFDMIALVGDYVGYWKRDSLDMLAEAFEPWRAAVGKIVAVPGNHDYWEGDPRPLGPLFEQIGIRLLRNELHVQEGVCWVGVDSFKALAADPFSTMAEALLRPEPKVVLWHEPDCVELLPRGARLMLSGHSHGGQWRFPWGWTPMHTSGGERYVRGFYPNAETPLFVTTGIGTTGPPARLSILPEVAVLRLRAG